MDSDWGTGTRLMLSNAQKSAGTHAPIAVAAVHDVNIEPLDGQVGSERGLHGACPQARVDSADQPLRAASWKAKRELRFTPCLKVLPQST